MKRQMKIGVLAYHGDVIEHVETTRQSAENLKLHIQIIPVREKKDVVGLDGLIIPGGESTTFYKLCERKKIFEKLKHIKYIFGTCAGAIMLAKNISNKEPNQKTLELMDITVNRNAYGRQNESFETDIHTSIGSVSAVFIRAPKITKVEKNVSVLAKFNKEIIACEETINGKYYLALCFHPELTTTLFHEYFLKKVFINNKL